MKVTLVTNYEGIMTYKNSFDPFEASGKYAGKSTDFVFEIQVDPDEIEGKTAGVGHVIVRRKYREE